MQKILVSVFIEFIKVFKIGFEPFFLLSIDCIRRPAGCPHQTPSRLRFRFHEIFSSQTKGEEFNWKHKLLKIFSENSIKIYRIENDYCWRANSVRKIRGSKGDTVRLYSKSYGKLPLYFLFYIWLIFPSYLRKKTFYKWDFSSKNWLVNFFTQFTVKNNFFSQNFQCRKLSNGR